ncbi:MAG: hypothetical protein R2818_04395 [Flavobacteriales bacterium]
MAFRAGDTAADAGWGIAVDDSANVYTTGVFFGTMDMDPGPEEALLVSEGGRDVYGEVCALLPRVRKCLDLFRESYTFPMAA